MGLLRFLLALAVAGGHTASSFGFTAAWIFPGSYAVQIFYIISGFVMAMILNEKYADTPQGNWIFYTNRAAKIFAPYLAILAVTVAVCLLSKAIIGDALSLEVWFSEARSMTWPTWAYALLTNALIVGQEWNFLLIYRGGSLFYSLQAYAEPPIGSQFTVIVPAWTLSIEILFYVIAPFIVRRHVLLIAGLAFASYLCRFKAYHLGYYSEATNYRFFPFELSLFLYGALCFRIGNLLPRLDAGWSAGIAAAMALTVVAMPSYFMKHPYQMYFIVGPLLPALFDFSRKNGWDRSLGNLSFPLYLVHWPVMVIALAVVRAIQPGPPGAIAAYPILAVMTSIAASVLINRYVVKPVDEWRQARVRSRAGAAGIDERSTIIVT